MAFATCSARGGCYEQFALGLEGIPQLHVALALHSTAVELLPPAEESCAVAGVGEAVRPLGWEAAARPPSATSSGRDLGAVLALHWVVGLLVAVFVALAVSLWGGFTLGLPQVSVETHVTRHTPHSHCCWWRAGFCCADSPKTEPGRECAAGVPPCRVPLRARGTDGVLRVSVIDRGLHTFEARGGRAELVLWRPHLRRHG